MNALLNIDEYFVEDIHIKANPAYKESDQESEGGQIQASIEVRRKGPEPEFMISMTIEVNKQKQAFLASRYYVLLNIVGYFSFVPNVDKTTIEKMIGLNGPSVLYGLARGVVAQITGNCRYGKFILPTVNFVEVMKKEPSEKRAKRKASGKTFSNN